MTLSSTERLLEKLRPFWKVSDPIAKTADWIDRCVSGTDWEDPDPGLFKVHNRSMNYEMGAIINCRSRLHNESTANISCTVVVNCGCKIIAPFSLMFTAITAVEGSSLGGASASLEEREATGNKWKAKSVGVSLEKKEATGNKWKVKSVGASEEKEATGNKWKAKSVGSSDSNPVTVPDDGLETWLHFARIALQPDGAQRPKDTGRIILSDGLGLVQVGDSDKLFSLVAFEGNVDSYSDHAKDCRTTKLNKRVDHKRNWPKSRALLRQDVLEGLSRLPSMQDIHEGLSRLPRMQDIHEGLSHLPRMQDIREGLTSLPGKLRMQADHGGLESVELRDGNIDIFVTEEGKIGVSPESWFLYHESTLIT
jgi:hypothetical protein